MPNTKDNTDVIRLSEEVYKLLRKSKKEWTIESLSNKFDVSCSKIRQSLDLLKEQGKNIELVDVSVELSRQLEPAQPTIIDISKFKGNKFIFGVTGDNHLGSKYARLDVLNALFDIWAEQGVKTVYQCGNMIDGEARFNKFDLLVHGMQDQVDYFVQNWPQRKGITTEFVTGDKVFVS